MTSTIKRIKLHNFRNYEEYVLDIDSSLIIIIGENAKGKTNLLEGVQLLTALDSFRKPVWNDVIRKGEETALVEIEVLQDVRELEIRMLVEDNKRAYYFNGKKKYQSDVLGIIPSVLFVPDDLQLVKGSPSKRRDFIDLIGSQMSKTYESILQDYNRIVRQKNQLLRDCNFDRNYLDSWNESLIGLGLQLYKHRLRLSDTIRERLKGVYERVCPQEHCDLEYRPSWQKYGFEGGDDEGDFRSALEMVKDEEIRRGMALVGPHRDEIVLYINGEDARDFASQGQQRTIALALKIAEVEVLESIMGYQPILLLDDVMSELDENRRAALMEVIEGSAQTFITTTNIGYFDEKMVECAQVVRL